MLTAEAERADAGATMGVRLLGDLREVFTIRALNGAPLLNGDGRPQLYDRLFTESILSGLYGIAEAPWASYYGRQLSARDLATLLGQFSVESRTVRIGESVRKGYVAADLWDVWQRYV